MIQVKEMAPHTMYWQGKPLADSNVERNAAILASRMTELDRLPGPRVGDYVEFADGKVRRVSHAWEWQADGPLGSYQTSDSGSWYLGNGYVSFSGGLYCGVPGSTLTVTKEKRLGRVWFFRNNWAEAHNGVETEADFRVYKCSEVAPK